MNHFCKVPLVTLRLPPANFSNRFPSESTAPGECLCAAAGAFSTSLPPRHANAFTRNSERHAAIISTRNPGVRPSPRDTPLPRDISFIRCRFESRIDSEVSNSHTRHGEAKKFNARSIDIRLANRQPHRSQFVIRLKSMRPTMAIDLRRITYIQFAERSPERKLQLPEVVSGSCRFRVRHHATDRRLGRCGLHSPTH